MSFDDARAIQEKPQDDRTGQMPAEPSGEPTDFIKLLNELERNQIDRQRAAAYVMCDQALSGSDRIAVDGKFVSSLRDAFLEHDRDRDLRLTEDEIDKGLRATNPRSKSAMVLQNVKDSFPALSILSGGDGDIEIGDIDRIGFLAAQLQNDQAVSADAEFALTHFEKIDSNGDGFLSSWELHSQCVSTANDHTGSERSLTHLEKNWQRIAAHSQEGDGNGLGISRADLEISPSPVRFNHLLFKTYQSTAQQDLVNKGITIGGTLGGTAGALIGLGGGPLGVAAGISVGALTGGITGTYFGMLAGTNVAKYQFEQNNASVRTFIENTTAGRTNPASRPPVSEPGSFETEMQEVEGVLLDPTVKVNNNPTRPRKAW